MKRGLLLNNVGTPEAPNAVAVKKYLDEFLMDPAIIGAPFPIRWLLVKGLITPRRSPKSAEKYAKVWTDRGSPLLALTRDLQKALSGHLGDEWVVSVGMRYGSPSIADALKDLRDAGVEEVLFAPLYPQYADSTTGTATREARRVLSEMDWSVPFRVLSPFHAHEEFLREQSERIRPFIENADHVLFSFHGLPESHVRKNEGCLRSADCCERAGACALNCYRAQSLRTAADLARKLALPKDRWTATFQSRLGPTKWIGPSTDETIRRLAGKGVKRLAVACPSFVTDCLETLEEIGIGAREDFLNAGGETFRLAPCLNASPGWIKALPAVLAGSHARTN